MNLPNKITLARICLIPVFVAVFYCGLLSRWCFLAAAAVFLLAAATDALDGHIARSRGLVTDLGKFLDPIADKVLVSTAFILLLTVPAAFTVSPFGGWGLVVAGICVALILARELIVSGFRMIAAGKNLVSIALLLVALAFLAGGDFEAEHTLFVAGEIISYIGLACFALCTVLTVVSGLNYLLKNNRVFFDDRDGAK